jgi:hypothetical protein
MQLHAGAGDALITPSDRDAMHAHLRRAYDLLEAGQLEYILHDAGHRLDWPKAATFLQHHLGGG